MAFNIKMEGFRCKTKLVTGGHMTKAPATIMYASIVSRETVSLALMITALNDLDDKSGDILNAYEHSPLKKKVWTTLGPEFGKVSRKNAAIVRALHGLKSAEAAFRNHLSKCMESLGYESYKADPDLWLKPESDQKMGDSITPIYGVM